MRAARPGAPADGAYRPPRREGGDEGYKRRDAGEKKDGGEFTPRFSCVSPRFVSLTGQPGLTLSICVFADYRGVGRGGPRAE